MRIRKQWHHLMSCPPPPDPTPPCQELHHYHYETPFLGQPKHHSLHHPQPQPQPQPQPKQEKHVPHSDLQPTQEKEWVCSNSDTSDGEKEEKKESSGDFKMKRGKLIMHHYTTKDPDRGKSVATDDDNRCAAMTNPRNTNEKRGCGSGTSISSSPASSLSSRQGGVNRWCKEEMTFPLKKRRESFKLIDLDEKKSSTTTDVRRKVVKKKPIVVEEDESKISTNTTVMRKARSGSNINGAMLMEGSKCSRVNGRGWRCYQQTLVGYALCEHHLGKARFRSISSNAPKKKKKKMINTVNDPQPLSSSTTTLSSSSEEMKELEEDKVMVRTILKKRKIGMVKARSLSSLLGLSTHHQRQHTPNSIAT